MFLLKIKKHLSGLQRKLRTGQAHCLKSFLGFEICLFSWDESVRVAQRRVHGVRCLLRSFFSEWWISILPFAQPSASLFSFAEFQGNGVEVRVRFLWYISFFLRFLLHVVIWVWFWLRFLYDYCWEKRERMRSNENYLLWRRNEGCYGGLLAKGRTRLWRR